MKEYQFTLVVKLIIFLIFIYDKFPHKILLESGLEDEVISGLSNLI
jgi:hypothetical protein